MASYEIQQNKTYRLDDNGERSQLCNFNAFITQEVRYVDGRSTETKLIIEGLKNDRDGLESKLPPVAIDAQNFPGMQWVMSAWGVSCVIQPGSGVKEDLRTQIQLASNPTIQTIYRHLGWTTIDGKPVYLHAGGAIGAKGNDPSVSVSLPPELARYNLATDVNVPDAVASTMMLLDLCPLPVAWTLLAATFAPLLGPVDFATHLTGRTGTFKSELISLFQSHYGDQMDARHLPGSWSSTANALEAQAYYAANAPFVVDDFVPSGTSWQVRAYQQTADKLIRSQGNQSGRARLTDTSNLQSTMYPRGIILSTGEDTPDGHSVRARMMILELSPGDVDPRKLTLAQKARSLYVGTTAAFVQWIALTDPRVTGLAEAMREKYIDIGHTRTPSMLGRLVASIAIFLEWIETLELYSQPELAAWRSDAETNIAAAAADQNSYLESADPCECFCNAIKQILASGLGHVRTQNGGIPKGATTLGWVSEGQNDDMPTFKSRGPCIGWINWQTGELCLDITGGYNLVKKVAGSDLSLTKQTMMKRLKDAGMLTRTDENRQRNSVRINAEGHPRNVLTIAIPNIIETQEVPPDDYPYGSVTLGVPTGDED